MTNPVIHSAPPAEQAKVRLLQRVVQFPLTRLIVALVALSLALALGNAVLKVTRVDAQWARPVITIVMVHLAYVFYVRWYERRSVAELDRWAAGRGLILGFIGGVSLLSAIIAVLAAVGVYSVTSWRGWDGVGMTLLGATAAAYVEEILFRGILYRLVERMTGTWLALLISAALFGAMHLGNPGASVTAAGALALEAGVLLGALFVLTRRLWAPIGLHLGWNFGVAGIYGLPVSGTAAHGIVEASADGPEWLTGGSFGVEASAVAVIACSAAATLMLYLALRKGLIVNPPWSRGTGKMSTAGAATPEG